MKNYIVFGNINGKALNSYFMHSVYKKTVLAIYKDGFALSILSSKKVDCHSSNLLNLIIRSINIVLLFNKQINFSLNEWVCNGDITKIRFFLICKKISIKNKETRFAVCEYISKTFQSKYDYRMCVLNNYIAADSYAKYTDKFRYLWSSFNAYYSAISSKRSERDKIDDFLKKFFGIERFFASRKDLDILIPKLDLSLNNEIIFENAKNIIKRFNLNVVLTDIESFLICECSYYYRNKYFHGEKTPPIISFENSKEIANLEKLCFSLREFIGKLIHTIIV